MGYGFTCVHDLRNSSFKKIGVNKSLNGLKIQFSKTNKQPKAQNSTLKPEK